MQYQLCLTMFQESLNNVMVKQGKGGGGTDKNATRKYVWLHMTLREGAHRQKLWYKAALPVLSFPLLMLP